MAGAGGIEAGASDFDALERKAEGTNFFSQLSGRFASVIPLLRLHRSIVAGSKGRGAPVSAHAYERFGCRR
jgi:hypothetical protein